MINLAGFFVLALTTSGCVSANPAVDLDLDGREDLIEISISTTDEPPEIEATLRLQLSRLASPVEAKFVSASGSFSAYPGQPGELILDYTNRSSRDSPELVYDVYRWMEEQLNLCLFASVDGIPPNQLTGELVPSSLQVTYFEGCTQIGHEETALPKASKDRPELSSQAVLALLDQDLTGWSSLNLTRSLSNENIDAFHQLASAQLARDNNEAAVILLEAILRVRPDDVRAREELVRGLDSSGG